MFIKYEAEVSSRVSGGERGVGDFGKLFTETNEQIVSLEGVKCKKICRCVDKIGDGIVKSDRSVVVLHHFGLSRTIGFQAAVSHTFDGKHPETSHQLIVRSRSLRR